MSETFTETVKVGLFGATGMQKTLQIGHLIEAYGQQNIGIVSCEHGLNTIRSYVSEEQVYPADNLDEFRAGFAWAKQKYVGKDKWVCVDGGTRAMQWVAGEIWKGSEDAYDALVDGKSRSQLRPEVRYYSRYVTKDLEIDGQRQWVDIGRAADRMFNAWVSLDTNSYWTFWEIQTSIDQYRKGLPWQLDCPGNGARDAAYGSFDFVFRLCYEDGRFMALCSPSSRVAKCKVRDDRRISELPEKIPDFTIPTLVSMLQPKSNVVQMPVNQPKEIA